ncbi:unnamed protein product [Gongylonema pulchrum]|uniref:G_PROTEIN_RECEP_F1_2 domain-containing protein n=1 Tax=Gongylonema pulchrum TaxID=637853 RepID=A0A183CVE3_9BILA|nr:unnamed protein product [Gongylonema pulchrum]
MEEDVREAAYLLASPTTTGEVAAASSSSLANSSGSNDTTTGAESMYGDRPAHCYYEQPPLTDERFWLVTVFGTTVSIISIIENVFLKRHRTTYNLYLMLLAFFDVFVSAAYVLLMSVNVLSDYLQSVSLMRLWFGYMVPIITISHIGMTSSSFLILAATFERYCITVHSKYVRFAQQHRKMIAAFAVLLGVISKGTMCLEFKVRTFLDLLASLAKFFAGTGHTRWLNLKSLAYTCTENIPAKFQPHILSSSRNRLPPKKFAYFFLRSLREI